MPTKRDLLAHLTRDELLAVVDRFALVAPDRRAKEGLVEAMASSKNATLAEILPAYSRDRLKELCRALRFDDGGKEKAPIVERFLGGKAQGEPSPKERMGDCDPTCKSGGMLIEPAHYLVRHKQDPKNLFPYGQEK